MTDMEDENIIAKVAVALETYQIWHIAISSITTT
jgi:hypothetical protein